MGAFFLQMASDKTPAPRPATRLRLRRWIRSSELVGERTIDDAPGTASLPALPETQPFCESHRQPSREVERRPMWEELTKNDKDRRPVDKITAVIQWMIDHDSLSVGQRYDLKEVLKTVEKLETNSSRTNSTDVAFDRQLTP